MILDSLDNRNIYKSLNRNFEEAFQFLINTDLVNLSNGKHPVKGDEIFALINHSEVVLPETIQMESHKKYIDIHYTISGQDKMGWVSLSDCNKPVGEFNNADDYILYTDQPQKIFTVNPNEFAIVFPTDVHAPLLINGPIHKVVLKVAI